MTLIDALTHHELEALVAYAKAHGRRWKSLLRIDWMNCTATGVGDDDRTTLVALRNKSLGARIVAGRTTTLALTTALASRQSPTIDYRPMTIKQLAKACCADWARVNYAAVPYLDAMHFLESIDDSFMHDSGRSIVAYFLSNASGWRGPVAKLVKAELKRRLNSK